MADLYYDSSGPHCVALLQFEIRYFLMILNKYCCLHSNALHLPLI